MGMEQTSKQIPDQLDPSGSPRIKQMAMEGKKQWKSKATNKKDRDGLKASIMALEPSIFHGIITDKFKEEKTLSKKL